jgi:AcrR family transcriptional regulator
MSIGPAVPAGSQRERILDAACVLLATRGFGEVTMADVAREARVARATVFNQFGSKHALVEAITADVFAHYHRMLDAALADAEHSTPTLVRALFDQMGVGIQSFLRFHRGVFREIARLQVGLDEGGAGQRAGEIARTRVVKLFERGLARGDVSRSHRAEDLAAVYDAVVNGTIMRWLYHDQTEPLRERMQRAAEVFLGAVAVGAAARSETPPQLAPEIEPIDPKVRRQPTGGVHVAKAHPRRRAGTRRARA